MSNTLKSLEELTGLKRITKKILLNLCKKNHLYQTPRLNDVLYLHYQGFRDIEELDEYTGLKCLWLECNAISEIKNLTNQPLLKCLFLQNNLVRKIENLNDCPELDTINLSHNHIANIENCGIEVLPVLTNLNLANNYIRTYDGLKGLLECKMLSVLDLSNNRIEDVLVVKIFSNMPELRVLILQGNPVVGLIPQYRKTLILECDNLTYLDSRPVFAKDRACAEAWKRGGYEEEKAEHERWIKEDQRRIRENVNSLIRLRNSYKNGKQQEVKLLTSDDENAKTDSDTSSGSSSDTESSKSSLEKENSIKDNESGTDNELNKINDDKSIKDISENDNENSENFVVTSTALNNNLGKEDISKEEIEPNHLLIKKRKKESERTFRKCKEHKKSNDRIWPKKYLLCEEPESILASANIFEETLDLKLEIEPSTTIVEQILNKIISDIEISQALNKNPKLDLKENMSRKLAEQNQNKNLEIEGVLEEKYFNDLIYDLKLPIVLEEQKQDEITQLEENEEFTPKEFNDMMDILKQNQNEEFATDDVTSTVGLNNISDTELEVTSSAVLSDQNSNGILITEKNENFMESLDLLESSQNDISDTKEIKKLNVSEGLEECLEKSCTLKQTETNEANEIEEQKKLEQTHVLSEEVENKTPKMEESQLTNELKKLTEMLDLLKQKRNESYETEKSQKSKKSQPEENLDLGFEDKSSLMISNKTETTGDFKEMLDETQENQSKQVLEVDKKSEKKPKEILCILEENNKEFLEFIGSEEIKKPINLNVQENLSSMLSDQYENVPSETDEFEEFKETKEQFSSDDENFKTSSDCGGSNVDSDSQTDNENEAETEYNYNANDQSLKEMTENLDKIEKDLNEVNFDEQFHEEIGFSKHMRVARSELNRRKCKAQKLSNDRNWLRKYLLQEEPEEVLATAITYHKTLIDFQLTWNPSESEENQIEPQKRIVDKNFDDAVNVNLEFQSCSSFLEELQKEISEANFANEHENLEENSCDVKSEQNQSITTLQNEE